MPEPAVAAQIHQPLDVHCDFAAQIAFHDVIAVDHLADLQHLGVAELVDPALLRDVDLLADFFREARADAMDIAKADFYALIGWDVYTRYTCHVILVVFRLSSSGCPPTPECNAAPREKHPPDRRRS